MAGMGEKSSYSGAGKDTVKEPSSASAGAGFDPVRDPQAPTDGGGLDVVTNPGGPNGTPVQKQGDGSMPNEASIPPGGKLPLDDLDRAQVKGGSNPKVDQGAPVTSPIQVTPANGAGSVPHKPFKVK